MSDRDLLNDCGCCEGTQDHIPAWIFNRPGLREIAYRSGTYSLFKQSLLAGLSRLHRPDMGGLRTRADDDFSVALIDAWAVAGDVLTFYIERTAHEHYLATATERRSVDDLVQLIGYRLLPGVAAETWLAFTLETTPEPPGGVKHTPTVGVPEQVSVRSGIRVQSVPKPDEVPQTFETTEDIEALASWNTLVPRRAESYNPQNGDTFAWLAGVGLDLNPGDQLLFVAADWSPPAPNVGWDLHRVLRVDADAVAQRTLVEWHGQLAGLPEGAETGIHAMRQGAALFGYNAPNPALFTDEVFGNLGSAVDATTREWTFAEIVDDDEDEPARLHLSGVAQGLEPDGWVMLRSATGTRSLGRIVDLSEQSRSGYGVSAQITVVEVDFEEGFDRAMYDGANVRATSILIHSDELKLAEAPTHQPVVGDRIQLTYALDSIDSPRSVIARGRRAEGRVSSTDGIELEIDGVSRTLEEGERLTVLSLDTEPNGYSGQYHWRVRTEDQLEAAFHAPPDTVVHVEAENDAPVVAEHAVVTEVQVEGHGAVLILEEPLANAFDRATIEILGNVVRATHGETVALDVLGSGDGSRPYQQFALRKSPLTYVRGDDAGSIDSTLEIWVDGVKWNEVPSFYGHRPRDRVYITRITDDGAAVVQFGDGESGARIPTGQDNIVATYRTGTGVEGLLDTGQLSLLMDRPLGVRGASNPLAPAGAAPRQHVDDARENAPRTVLTLGRIVSLQDYEDFAQDFLGISKASAVWTWGGERRGVFITVAGLDGAGVPEGELMHTELSAAMAAAGSPRVPVVIREFRPDTFRISGTLRVQTDRDANTVLQQVRGRLAATFSFAHRSFGQIVTLSELYAAIHSVPGVDWADLNHLYRGDDARLDPYLIVEAPTNGASPDVESAELLTLDAQSLDDLEIVP